MTKRPQSNAYSQTVARRIRELRHARGWSAQQLADKITDAGCPMLRTTIANMESRPGRHIVVDELYALGRVFAVPVDSLAHDHASCPSCGDQPPAGFRCLACGADTP